MRKIKQIFIWNKNKIKLKRRKQSHKSSDEYEKMLQTQIKNTIKN